MRGKELRGAEEVEETEEEEGTLCVLRAERGRGKNKKKQRKNKVTKTQGRFSEQEHLKN